MFHRSVLCLFVLRLFERFWNCGSEIKPDFILSGTFTQRIYEMFTSQWTFHEEEASFIFLVHTCNNYSWPLSLIETQPVLTQKSWRCFSVAFVFFCFAFWLFINLEEIINFCNVTVAQSIHCPSNLPFSIFVKFNKIQYNQGRMMSYED